MSNIKFTQLPNLGNVTAATIIPVVDSGVNYTVTGANLQAYVNGGNGNITTNNLSATGNITTGNLSATGNVTGAYLIGNGSQLTGLPPTYTNANVVSLLSSYGSNTISTTGNVTAGYVLGDGSQLTNLPVQPGSYGNANVAAYLPTNTANVAAGNVIISGNLYLPGSANAVVYAAIVPVTGTVVQANAAVGSVLTYNIPGAGTWEINAVVNGFWNKNTASDRSAYATLYDSSNVQVGNSFTIISLTNSSSVQGTFYASGTGTFIVTTTGAATYDVKLAGTGAQSSGSFGTYKQLNANVAVASVGYVGALNYAGNVTATDNLIAGGYVSATGNVQGGNIRTVGAVSATGNVTGAYIIGNGSQLTGLPGASGNLSGNLITGTYYIKASETSSPTQILVGSALNVSGLGGASVFNNGILIPSNGGAGGFEVEGVSTLGTSTSLGPYIERTASAVNSNTSFTPTMSSGPVQKVTANNNFTLNLPSGMVTGQSITLVITQDATGSRLMTANASYKFAYGIETLSTAANSIDMLSIFYDGTNYLCNLVKGYV